MGFSTAVKPGARVRLRDIDPDDTQGVTREQSVELLERDRVRLTELHEKLYAENRRALLVVLQAMDTGGKDGTVKHVLSGLNPAGCEITSFKAPSFEERDHDFLWRIYHRVPARGNIGLFNRSHYEDVLIVRVHGLVPEKEWSRRYDQINRFEELLSDLGTTVVKFFLHISKDEQKKRIEDRLRDPEKHWKFDADDLKERAYWDDYQTAYEAALSRCSTRAAPWHIIAANKKWFRNLAVARTIVETLEAMDPKPPKPGFDPSLIVVK